MYDCIFSGYCTENCCDRACPVLAQVSYLMELNNLNIDNPVLKLQGKPINECTKILDNEKPLSVIENNNISLTSDLFTYCAICKNWYGSRLNCKVYNLNYSKYLDEIKKSWSMKSEPDELEYSKIWSEAAKVLIISNLDFINFKDFEAQTLLNLIQNRESDSKSTIVIVKKVSELIGTGPFFDKMQKIFDRMICL